jgi:protocatechuate 3,4-dioxygenase beta subunit
MERRITRRQALGAAGSAGAALLVARGPLSALGELVAAAPAAAATKAGTVTVTPAMTEGPYWIDEMLRRFDVRTSTSSSGSAQAGIPLALKINVLDAASGGAINGAHVDIWHANAYGLYSDEAGQPGGTSTTGQNFLRGYQITGVDAGALAAPLDGQVNFRTIWPGWYQGRAIHIHVRVRTYDGSAVATNYTTQIFFSDDDNARVLNGAAPYNTRSPRTDPTTDETDNIFASSNVSTVSGSVADGFATTFTIGLQGVASNADSEAVAASIVSAKVIKAESGARTLVFSVKANGAATAHATLARNSKTLAKATGHLTAGTQSLRMALGKGVAAGPATLTLVVPGSVTRTRKVTVPATG